jgi:FkbM family methyltransferase
MKASGLFQVITLRGHTFIPRRLNANSTVIDLGANEGEFSRSISARYRCRCIAVEPNPTLFAKIEKIPQIEAVHGAIADRSGSVQLALSDNIEASSILIDGPTAVTVPALTLEELFLKKKITYADVVKVDIEGAEAQMFLSLPDRIFQMIGQITIEFHEFCGLITKEDRKGIVATLSANNFESIPFGSDNMNWLFVNRSSNIGALRRAYVKNAVRPARNALRSFRSWSGADWMGLSPE